MMYFEISLFLSKPHQIAHRDVLAFFVTPILTDKAGTIKKTPSLRKQKNMNPLIACKLVT